MATRIAIFWPGDYRPKPNELALPSITKATAQLEAALKKLGRPSCRVDGWLTKPHEAIEKLGPIDDPLIGVCVHWFYGPHTTDGVVGKDNPLLLASNFSGQWPGLVGLLNTAACLESVGRKCSRVWTNADDWTRDDTFMARLQEWCTTGQIEYPEAEIASPPPTPPQAAQIAQTVHDEIKRRRVLAMMLGDTSMGMINGYLGTRLLNPIGFTEHKVDQAWIIDRGRRIDAKRIDAALAFVKEKGVRFHWQEEGAADFDENATREQLRDYLTVLDLVAEFKADCLGWQYQLGLLPLRPPSDFSEGLLNSVCRPESNGDTIVCSTAADQGNLVPMELMKRLLKAKGLHQAVMFHDVRWGGEHDGRFVWVLLNSGSCGAYAFNHDPQTLKGVHSYRQPAGYFPVPGGTFTGESLHGKVTWARAWITTSDGATERRSDEGNVASGLRARREDAAAGPGTGRHATVTTELWMDIGRGEVVRLPDEKRDAWWKGTTEQWPFMATDLGITRDTLMAHYMSNHIAVAYGDIFSEMVALSQALGFKVRVLSGT
jgi:L-fucose isomerase-like protein